MVREYKGGEHVGLCFFLSIGRQEREGFKVPGPSDRLPEKMAEEIDLKALKNVVNAVLDHVIEDVGLEKVKIEDSEDFYWSCEEDLSVGRLSFALFIVSGSFFLGQQRVFPASLRGAKVWFVPAFLPLILMIFWLLRVWFTNEYKRTDPPYRTQTNPVEFGKQILPR
jgi:hypothetical protein